jgi:hypothetical protein
MRRLIICIVCCMCWVVIGSGTAHGADAVDAAITQLTAGARVYVEPGTPGTTADTTAKLQQALTENDHIVLVMLPADSSSTVSLDQIALRIDTATKHQLIVGVTRGTEASGYSMLMPHGVASDAMTRAQSIAPNQTEALLTYARLIHNWQAAHPSPTASPPSDGNAQQGGEWWHPVASGGLLSLAVGTAAFWIVRRRNAGLRARSTVASFNASPPMIREQLQELLMYGHQVRDESLRQEITSIATNINDFFELSHASNRETSDDAKAYAGHLGIVIDALRSYVVIQSKPHLFKGAAEKMKEASVEIKQFGGFVLSSIQRSNDVDLRSFKTSIATLKAFGEIAEGYEP